MRAGYINGSERCAAASLLYMTFALAPSVGTWFGPIGRDTTAEILSDYRRWRKAYYQNRDQEYNVRTTKSSADTDLCSRIILI